jgi:predicted nucleic acid-binding protein
VLLYLDLNGFNRPFDDQSQERIALETEAFFTILQRIVDGEDELVWSASLDLENSHHPIADRRAEIAEWAEAAGIYISVTEAISQRADRLTARGLAPLDATHVACAEAAGCDRLLTCDDRMLRRARRLRLALRVQDPIGYLEDVTNG